MTKQKYSLNGDDQDDCRSTMTTVTQLSETSSSLGPSSSSNSSSSSSVSDASSASLAEIFKYGTNYDYFLLVIGVIGALVAGINFPLLDISFGKVVGVFVAFEKHRDNITSMESLVNDNDHSDHTIKEQFIAHIMYWSVFTAISFALFMISITVTLYAFQLMSSNLTNTLKYKYFQSILSQEIAWHEQHRSGEFITRITSDFKKFENTFNENFGLLIYNCCCLFVNLTISFYYGWKLSALLVTLAPIFILTSWVMTKFMNHYQQRESDETSISNSLVNETINSIRTIYAYNGQYVQSKRYEQSLRESKRYFRYRSIVSAIGNSINWSILYFCISLGLWYGIKLMLSPADNYRIDDLIIIFWSIASCGMNIAAATPYYDTLVQGKMAAKILLRIIERKSSMVQFTNDDYDYDRNGHNDNRKFSLINQNSLIETIYNDQIRIEFRNVKFHYPSRPDRSILNHFNVEFNSNDIVALVGPSGGGKSTIIQLLQRFYDPIDGEILLNGRNVKSIDIDQYRLLFGVVEQEPRLFNASIVENICIGLPDNDHGRMIGGQQSSTIQIDQNELEILCRKINAHEFIAKLPQSYQTIIGAGGKQLSGGQKQRLAIARALIRNPRILLLDEATSALDNETESIVRDTIDSTSDGRITIVVAHRLSTIRNATKILYIEHGRIMEQGTHDQLMEINGRYCRMIRSRQKSLDVDDSNDHGQENSDTEDDDDDDHEDHKSNDVQLDMEKIGEDPSNIDPANDHRRQSSIRIKNPLKGRRSNQSIDGAGCKSKKFPFKRILSMILANKYSAVIAVIMALLYGSSTPLYAYIFGEFVQLNSEYNLQDNSDRIVRQTNMYSLYFLILGLAIIVCCTIQLLLFNMIGENLSQHLRMLLFESLLQQPVEFYDRQCNQLINQNDAEHGRKSKKLRKAHRKQMDKRSGNNQNIICLMNDVINIRDIFSLRISIIIQTLSIIMISIVMGLFYSWQLTFVSLLLLPVIIISTLLSDSIQMNLSKLDQQLLDQTTALSCEIIASIQTIYSLNNQRYFLRKFQRLIQDYRKSKWKLFFKSLLLSLSLGIQFFAYIIVFIYGAYLLYHHQLTSGDFLKIVESMVWGAIVVGQTSCLSSDFTKTKLTIVNLFQLIGHRKQQRPAIQPAYLMNDTKFAEKSRLNGDIQFTDVTFHYPLRPKQTVLNNFSVKIMKGEKVAFVGRSGCGKSTIVQLLQRFYDNFDGYLTIDGYEIRNMDIDWLRSQMAVVSQEPVLFNMTIRENIAYGNNFRRSISFNEIVRAAKLANAHEFICELPNGYNTIVGNGKMVKNKNKNSSTNDQLGCEYQKLSGGQRQRLAIARALIRNPSILLLDEATSALDNESESLVIDNIYNNSSLKHITCITIAHRLKTIRNSDRIFVMKNGQIVEQGKHVDLMKSKQTYWKLNNCSDLSGNN